MRFSISKIALVVVFVFSLGGLSQAQTSNIARSDILKHIVTQCVDLNKKDYCSNCALPRVDSPCISNAECRQTNEVWAQTSLVWRHSALDIQGESTLGKAQLEQ